MTRRGGSVAGLALLAWGGGGSSGGAAAVPPSTPARVVIEQVIGGPGSGRRTFAQWLAGTEPRPLFERPYGAAWDGDELIVTDPAAGRVVRLDSAGRLLRSSPEGAFTGPIGVAVCRWGGVVTDSRAGTVTLVDGRLRPVRLLAEGLSRPTGVACDAVRIFVAETGAHRLLALRPEGGVLDAFGRRGLGEAEFNFPVALAAEGDTLWIGDTLNFRLQRLRASDGAFLRAFGQVGDAPGETPRIKGIAAGPGGLLWVSDAFLDRVDLFRSTGEFVAALGEPGQGPGQFAFPAGIAGHPDGRVAVVDSLNRRVQVMRLLAPSAARAPR